MAIRSKIAFSKNLLCTLCVVVFACTASFAQKIDTSRLSIKPKPKVATRVPVLKTTIQPYRPANMSYVPTTTVAVNAAKQKILSVLKIYPNPVSEQININLRLDRDISFSVKITDILGNDVATLANERSSAGEQTKTYTIPSRLNPGIYYLKILAGGEQVVKKISVL